ncbi:putative serine/threonine protein kinase [Corallococcus coralloides DSM 2259]|uniref:Putative serine/threonine protein kinase n=1 Tax=Corallococcus coralloides (strain ATCC 25202 / DSM 2259 / NBRC 100086 / M2) TaxID=1144275 RepID=H8MKV1_CORCM|nr:serine/threonine-protein kinase [Corallococcus coralloides]AFE06024.1 putative serine/threonine protein kinase [Corallococcus coralloides DSM 2259]
MQKPTEPTSAQSEPLTTGRVLRSTYEIGTVLGKGGMGAVFLARHLRLPGKQVAIKVLHGAEALSEEVAVRFRREAEIASRLGHPNIVEVLDFDTLEDGTPFMVMEYLRGEGLSRRLRKQKQLPLDEVFSITRQMGAALQAAHRAGVVHRDLKPGNVFLVPTEAGGVVGERVKLLDFGISKLVDARTVMTLDSVLMGTPQYMAPEQAMGHNSNVDARTDLFAFGCIVYEMLAGRPPYSGDNVAELIYQIVHLEPPPLLSLAPGTPPHVVAAISRAMAKKPEDRYPDVGAFILELTGSPLQTLAEVKPEQRSRPTTPTAPPSAPRPPDREEHIPTVGMRPHAGRDTSPPPSGPQTESLAAQPLAPARPKWPVAVAVGMAVIIAFAVAFFWKRPDVTPPAAVVVNPPAQPRPSTPVTPPPAVVVAPPEDVKKPVEPEPQQTQPTEPEEPRQPTTDLPTANAKPKPRGTPESMPDSVREDLVAAQKALDASNTAEALRHIRRSQRTKITGLSFSLLTRVYCQQHDLANARAQWTRVPATERPRVRQYCSQYDIDL